ncbi:hypothetical protein U1Q18_024717 [Sarracenia purpurea var. burkii]
MSKESGSTCMNPVARMIPAANDLTITKRFRSGLSAGIERVTRGEPTPTMLVTIMQAMATIFSGRALDLSMQSPNSDEHSSGATERAREVKKEMRTKKMEMSLTTSVEEAMDSSFLSAAFKLLKKNQLKMNKLKVGSRRFSTPS